MFFGPLARREWQALLSLRGASGAAGPAQPPPHSRPGQRAVERAPPIVGTRGEVRRSRSAGARGSRGRRSARGRPLVFFCSQFARPQDSRPHAPSPSQSSPGRAARPSMRVARGGKGAKARGRCRERQRRTRARLATLCAPLHQKNKQRTRARRAGRPDGGAARHGGRAAGGAEREHGFGGRAGGGKIKKSREKTVRRSALALSTWGRGGCARRSTACHQSVLRRRALYHASALHFFCFVSLETQGFCVFDAGLLLPAPSIHPQPINPAGPLSGTGPKKNGL